MIASGLPGTKRDLEVLYVHNAAKLGKVICGGKCASAAGDHGAISVWIDDSGKIRGEWMRHCRTMDSQTFPTLKALQGWFKDALKQIA